MKFVRGDLISGVDLSKRVHLGLSEVAFIEGCPHVRGGFYQGCGDVICISFAQGSTDEDVLLAVDCLDKLLRNQRQVSSQRVLGFVKRLATVSLQLSPGASLAVLATIRKFIQVQNTLWTLSIACYQLLAGTNF